MIFLLLQIAYFMQGCYYAHIRLSFSFFHRSSSNSQLLLVLNRLYIDIFMVLPSKDISSLGDANHYRKVKKKFPSRDVIPVHAIRVIVARVRVRLFYFCLVARRRKDTSSRGACQRLWNFAPCKSNSRRSSRRFLTPIRLLSLEPALFFILPLF